MANIIETFLTIRGFEYGKTGSIIQRDNAYVTVEQYKIDANETLRGLDLELSVKSVWTKGKSPKVFAQEFFINKTRIDNDYIFDNLREYL